MEKKSLVQALLTLAILCMLFIAAASASAQSGQPWDSSYGEPFEAPRIFRVDTPSGTWQHGVDLQNKKVNRNLASMVVVAAFPVSGVVLGPLFVVDFFVTKRKQLKNANLAKRVS